MILSHQFRHHRSRSVPLSLKSSPTTATYKNAPNSQRSSTATFCLPLQKDDTVFSLPPGNLSAAKWPSRVLICMYINVPHFEGNLLNNGIDCNHDFTDGWWNGMGWWLSCWAGYNSCYVETKESNTHQGCVNVFTICLKRGYGFLSEYHVNDNVWKYLKIVLLFLAKK